jgi:flavorubredoxin
METRIDEIADGIYRLSTYIAEVAPPAGFTFNQFLVKADQPLLFHTGMRGIFPLVSQAVARIVPVDSLRWIAFGHVEADECGSMNTWLEAAPHAQIAHGQIACAVSLNDLADRAPRALNDGEVLDLGGKRVRYLATPHLPHGWDAGLMFEETTGTLLCSDLLGQIGDGPAIARADIVGPALESENVWRSMSVTRETVPQLRRLAALEPKTLAIMHGSSLNHGTSAALRAFADSIGEQRLAAAA